MAVNRSAAEPGRVDHHHPATAEHIAFKLAPIGNAIPRFAITSDARSRLTVAGALFLGIVAILPNVLIHEFGFSQATARGLGGTSILIVVGVALDIMRQMESQLTMRHYEGFLSK